MTHNVTAPGLILLQEVGFDIVSIWSHMGYLAKGVLVLAPLTVVCLAAFAISRMLRRLRGRSR